MVSQRRLVGWSLAVALGGFLFGFDTAVISGAEQEIQTLWGLSDALHGFAVAVALYGTVIGALFGGIPADRLGRRSTLQIIGVLYLVSAVGSALAPEVVSFMVFRFIGGLGVGASSVAAPMYISEIAPPDRRGRLVALFQFNIVLGILLAYVSNYVLGTLGLDWRWMMGVEAVPALAFVYFMTWVPISPRWLVVQKGRVDDARAVLARVGWSPDEIDRQIAEIQASVVTDAPGRRAGLFSPQFRRPVVLAVLFAFFNQLSGINAIIYYAPRIFEMTGLGGSAALLSSAGIGLVNLIFTMLGLVVIDRFGRRSLMLVGSVGLIAALASTAWAFSTETFAIVPALLFVYIAFFALSQGAVIWVFISEIFPNQVRAGGQSLGSFTHWILAAVVANVFPIVAARVGGGPVFAVFCGMMVLQLLFVWFVMPETKNTSLEALEHDLVVP
ncbi:sugar porter family MFS transporter [Rubrivirga marina]|uniref:MFS transporter n=1 Tax=Rubrivirga marina TaxID=1196024 RepID=A0A271IYM1_9BACT|nr:sugar porter family MFS transporter [Rubrivirga marina]PAP75619.1 MFS transporter [Rubrivirga marina]